jgi:glyoxylate utilization-related uncharacterized protein
MSLDECRLIDFQKVEDRRGNLTIIESERSIPFAIRRVFYLYDVPGGAARGAHGHKRLQQLIIAMSGSFDVNLDDGAHRKKLQLNRAYHGLYVPPMTWCSLDNFSSGAVALVLASNPYDESDYYRDYDVFLAAAR